MIMDGIGQVGFHQKVALLLQKSIISHCCLRILGHLHLNHFVALRDMENNGITLYPSQSSTGALEQITYDRSLSTNVNNDYLGNASATTSLYSKNFSGSAQYSTSAAPKSEVVQAVKENPVWIHCSASVLALHKWGQSAGHQFVVDNAGTGMCGTLASHPSLGSKKSSPTKKRKVDTSKYLSETFWDDRNCVS
ncbi:hypothetical protein IHE45_01G027900 [Dioscorea alata]|uniref:Uncharacterized protein n=1 Tax=Dioscorea alata TaxID=55571 RepID=A0ACB7WT66_DIOAL|nr:hypothetical protein IHE45_01G027900 [Dioscorea alata]